MPASTLIDQADVRHCANVRFLLVKKIFNKPVDGEMSSLATATLASSPGLFDRLKRPYGYAHGRFT